MTSPYRTPGEPEEMTTEYTFSCSCRKTIRVTAYFGKARQDRDHPTFDALVEDMRRDGIKQLLVGAQAQGWVHDDYPKPASEKLVNQMYCSVSCLRQALLARIEHAYENHRWFVEVNLDHLKALDPAKGAVVEAELKRTGQYPGPGGHEPPERGRVSMTRKDLG